MKRLTLLLTCCCLLLGGRAYGVDATDNFNRANGTLNGSTASDGVSVWTNSGTFNVASNQATGAGNSSRCWIDCGSADVEVQVTKSTTGATGANRCGLLVRYVDASNYLFFHCNGTAFTANKVVAGTSTSLGTGGSVVAGDVLKVVANGSSVALYVNGSLLLGPYTVTDHQTATKHGLYSAFSADSMDDFSIVDLSAPPPSGNGLTYPLIIGQLTRPSPRTRFVSFTPLMLEAR